MPKTSDENYNKYETIEDCFDDNIIDVYRKRPRELESLTLFQFASWYEKRPLDAKPQLPLLDRSGSLHKRTRALCLRTSNLSTNSEDYYYSLLLLHLPHRTEDELTGGFTNIEQAFLAKEDQMNQGELQSEKAMDELIASAQRLRTAIDLEERVAEEDGDDDEILADEYDAVDTDELECPVVLQRNPQRLTLNEEKQWQSLSVGEMSPETFREKLKSLSNDQKRVLKYLHWRLNDKKEMKQIQLFLTGNAGTGKSFLLEVIIEWLRLTKAKYSGHDPVAVAAPTGLAAKAINGVTLHSLLKLPIQHDGSMPEKLNLQYNTLQRLKAALKDKQFLVVDEVSMLGEKMLVFCNDRLQEVFDNEKPFGGINVIFSGDFFQLPPVKDKLCFNHALFMNFDMMMLEQNMRQKEDIPWCRILDKIRIGSTLTGKEVGLLNSRIKPEEEMEDLQTDLRLYPTKKQVEEYNTIQQEKLTNETGNSDVTIPLRDVYSVNDAASGCIAETDDLPNDDRNAGGLSSLLTLSVGSKVMCIKNLGDGIINGSTGEVHSFEFRRDNEAVRAIFVQFDDRDSGNPFKDPNRDDAVRIEEYSQEFRYRGRAVNRVQCPLIPAWSVSIHKSQGMSLNTAVTDIGGKIFAKGQIYVALSRVKKLEGLYIQNGFRFNEWWQPSQQVKNFYVRVKYSYAKLKQELKYYKVKRLFD